MTTYIKGVCARIQLELSISLSETKASLSREYKSNFRVEISYKHLSVHSRYQGFISVDICKVECKRGCLIVSKADLLQA